MQAKNLFNLVHINFSNNFDKVDKMEIIRKLFMRFTGPDLWTAFLRVVGNIPSMIEELLARKYL